MDGSVRAVAPRDERRMTPADMAWRLVWAIDAGASPWQLREMAGLLAHRLDKEANHD